MAACVRRLYLSLMTAMAIISGIGVKTEEAASKESTGLGYR
jgi:hypothetical protein